MEILEAIILGIIQGLTEFLPISSSGHLEIGKWLLGERYSGEAGLWMTVLLHAGTALATVGVFRKDIAAIITGWFRPGRSEAKTFTGHILLSMIPAVLVGLYLEKEIETLFTGNILLVGVCLMATGVLLFVADRPYAHTGPLIPRNALWMGIAQAIAILPGISRSGATIGTALLLKMDRGEAARFSFLMVVPLILGKMAKDVLDAGFEVPAGISAPAAMAGFAAAFISGWLACTWMIALVQKAKLRNFAYYCLAIGTLSVLAFLIW